MGSYGKKIVITGANCFVARHLIQKLQKAYYIYAIVKKGSEKGKNNLKRGNVKIIELDMSNYDKLKLLVKEDVDILFHFAWAGTRGADREDPIIQQENYLNSMKLLKAIAYLKCSHVISAGSQAEYGHHSFAISEDAECKPVSMYGKQKLKFYLSAQKFCCFKKIKFTEPRFFSLYGADDYEGTMVISILKKMINGKKCELTKGIQFWDFLHVDDAAEGLLKLIENDVCGGVYNFGSGNVNPLKYFVLKMKEITQSKSKLLFGAIPYPKSGMVSIIPNVEKLKQTGWVPKISFSEGISEIVTKIHEGKNENY